MREIKAYKMLVGKTEGRRGIDGRIILILPLEKSSGGLL
jgi:hypothetical protein